MDVLHRFNNHNQKVDNTLMDKYLQKVINDEQVFGKMNKHYTNSSKLKNVLGTLLLL